MAQRFFSDLVPTPESDERRDICLPAARFEVWTRELCRNHGHSLVGINQAKVLLLDKYFEWRAYVPLQHRNRVSEHSHHCIWHVFEDGYRTLRLLELSMNPPMLFLPPPPPPPAPPPSPPVITGITLGEVLGEE
jgi:hypothetical protein